MNHVPDTEIRSEIRSLLTRHRVESGPVSHPLERLRGLRGEQLLILRGGAGEPGEPLDDRGSGGLSQHG